MYAALWQALHREILLSKHNFYFFSEKGSDFGINSVVNYGFLYLFQKKEYTNKGNNTVCRLNKIKYIFPTYSLTRLYAYNGDNK